MRAINTFEGGVVQTIDPHKQAPNTMRYALNGRIMYNTDMNFGNPGDDGNEDGNTYFAASRRGMSFAFCTDRGNLKISELCAGYEIMGMEDIGEALIVISTTGSTGNAQIGILTILDDLTNVNYKILFDDKNDPNGDKLRIKKASEPGAKQVKISYVSESSFIKRIYFNDGYNQERCLNLMLAYQQTACNPAPCDNLSTLTPIHVEGSSCGLSSATYPKHLSVHHMDSRMDLVYPRIKFKQRINGALKRGVYQYAIRYKSRDGHRSVWSTITKHIVVTGTHYPNNPEYLKPVAAAPFNNANGFSHHNRFMSGTDNDSITDDGIRLDIKGLDQRWNSFELAYIYSKTDLVSHEANVFYTYDEACGSTPMPSIISVDHKDHTGIPIAFEEFNQRYETILSQEDMVQNKNRMYRLGAELPPEVIPVLTGATITPKFRYLRADETLEPNFVSRANPKTGKNDGDPLTNSLPKTTNIGLTNFTGSTELYDVIDDYVHYKGQQVEHLLAGYWRGETYGIGVLFRDRKGNPLFVHHIKDVTFPQQYETSNGESCSLTKLDTGRWELRIMGMSISGIKIPKKCLRDKFGKLNVSGFEIVRTKRNAKILHQGIIYPVINVGVGCKNSLGKGEDLQPYIRNKPMPFLKNKFDLEYDEGVYHRISADLQGNEHYILRDDVEGSWIPFIRNKEKAIGERITAYPAYSMYASPDVMFEDNFDFLKDTDRIKHVGTVHRGYTKNEIPLIGSGFPSRNINQHNYTKSYSTINQEGNPALIEYGRPKIGSESNLKFAERMTESWFEKKGIDPDRTDMTFRNGFLDVAIADQAAFYPPGSGAGTTAHKLAYGVGVKNTLFLGSTSFEHVDIHYGDSEVSYRIVNYMRPNSSYYTEDGENSFDSRSYISTGHFQPLTEAILATVTQDADNYTFNEIEVWGGDCFVNFFDWTTTLSQSKFDCDQGQAAVSFEGDLDVYNCNNIRGDRNIGYKDYSYSRIVPLESKYNVALRYGRTFASAATMPQETFCDNEFLQYSGGINDKQQESFDINRVLLHEENIQFFSVKPQEIKLVSSKSSSVYVSEQKTYSELDDSYRKQKVNNYTDLDGAKGKGVALVTSFGYIYVFQEFGYGILRAAERAIVPSTVGELILGTGKELDGADYLSSEVGCQHQSSIISFDNAIYWIDAAKGLVCRHGQSGREDISDTQLLHDFVAKELLYFDNRLAELAATGDINIIGGFDHNSKDVFFTFKSVNPNAALKKNLTKTVAFNKAISAVHGFFSFYPHLYGSHRKLMLVIDPASTRSIYVHGKGRFGHYFGQYHKSVLEFYVNDRFQQEKIFDTARINMEQVGAKRIGEIVLLTQSSRHVLYYQQSNIQVDSRFKFRGSYLEFPLFQYRASQLPRLHDQVMMVRITIDNQNQAIDNQDIGVAITNFETNYRLSNKI